MRFVKHLEEMGACREALGWCGKRGLKRAWHDAARGDWMLWLAGRLHVDRKLLVLAACDCAETVLQYVPEGEGRPTRAIQTSRNWGAGNASPDDVRAAAAAATAAAYAAAYADAAYAAYGAAAAAAAAAYAATDATDAAYAATDAAATAAYAADADAAAAGAAYADATAAAAAVRTKAHYSCAALVRARIPYDVIATAWRERG